MECNTTHYNITQYQSVNICNITLTMLLIHSCANVLTRCASGLQAKNIKFYSLVLMTSICSTIMYTYYFPISSSMHTPPHKCVHSCKNSKQHNCLKTVMVLTFPTTKKGTSEICINDSGPSFECDVGCRTQELTTGIVHQKVKTPMHFHCVSDKLLHLLVAVIAKKQKALLNMLTANIKLSHALAIKKA